MSLQTRRDDLQCWRALSILAVLLFHIWPEQFPNGYLGVDIFFVLSGYLMACLFTFESKIVLSVIDFYYRRIKRILPIYLFIILITLLILAKQVFPDEYTLIVEDSKWAIGLATNYEDLLKKRGYFDAEASFRFFRHCWSLAVEMQFYLLFPFIAISRNYFSPTKYQLLLIFISALSGLYQIYSPNEIIQYESLFCRIWQFSAGMFAQTIPTFSIKLLPSLLLFGISAIIFCSVSLPRLIISFITIYISAGIISMSTTQFHPFKSIFKISIILDYLVILGDISYVLYLIHWPLITYSKFMSATTFFDFFNGSLIFLSSILLAKIVHIIIEKPMLKICNCYRNLALCLIILYSCSIYLPEYVPKKDSFLTVEKHDPSNLTLQFYKEISINFNLPIKIPPKWTIENDIEFAEKFYGIFMGGAIPCTPDIIQTVANKKQYCEINGTNPNGTLIGLAFGNSYAMNIATAIAANPLFKKVILVFGNGATFPDHGAFDKYLIEKLIKPLKPNVIFMVQKYYYFQKYLYKTPITKIKENKEFKNWNNILKVIQNFTSAIIINKEQIIFDYEISRDFIRRKINGLQIEARLKNPPPSPNLEAWLSSLNCLKCQFFGYREAFCDGEFCNVLDLATGLPLFRDSNHISPVGIRHLKPFIDKAIHKALNICVL